MNEIAAAPKFETIFLSNTPPNDKGIKELIKWCGIFHKKELAPCYGKGTFGNLSYRIEPGFQQFIITASGLISKETLRGRDFVEIDSADTEAFTVKAQGSRAPSSESILHHVIYQPRPEINAIFHGHCTKIMDNAARLNIPCTSKEQPYGTKALIKEVLAIIKDNDFVIMKNHGFISLGKNMSEAGERALKYLDRSCQRNV
ncbi:MAG: class II aldolase/adducin family protein [Candidatus Margulisiibacteriota bacterium]